MPCLSLRQCAVPPRGCHQLTFYTERLEKTNPTTPMGKGWLHRTEELGFYAPPWLIACVFIAGNLVTSRASTITTNLKWPFILPLVYLQMYICHCLNHLRTHLSTDLTDKHIDSLKLQVTIPADAIRINDVVIISKRHYHYFQIYCSISQGPYLQMWDVLAQDWYHPVDK